ncbi:MAG: hypothetical protein HUU37_06080, partial [Bdellovibrionales bacterium]|nr:hypothetical protein [Bdellovibrionales bacterium]
QKKGLEQIQAVFFRPGVGFYVVTASYPSARPQAVVKDLERALQGAKFYD